MLEFLNFSEMAADGCHEGFMTVSPLNVTGATGSPHQPSRHRLAPAHARDGRGRSAGHPRRGGARPGAGAGGHPHHRRGLQPPSCSPTPAPRWSKWSLPEATLCGRGRPSGSPAGGDAADGAFFQFLNAGKRSVAIDLDDPEGRRRFLELAATADLVVEDLGAGVVESMGLGHAELAEQNPAVVLLSISPVGPWGAVGPSPGQRVHPPSLGRLHPQPRHSR